MKGRIRTMARAPTSLRISFTDWFFRWPLGKNIDYH